MAFVPQIIAFCLNRVQLRRVLCVLQFFFFSTKNLLQSSTKSTPKKYKLPNVSEFARKLSDNDLNNLKFDLNSDSWYILENNIWTRISSNKAYKLVWNILENHEETRGNFTPDYHKKLCLSLTWCSGVEFCSRQH